MKSSSSGGIMIFIQVSLMMLVVISIFYLAGKMSFDKRSPISSNTVADQTPSKNMFVLTVAVSILVLTLSLGLIILALQHARELWETVFAAAVFIVTVSYCRHLLSKEGFARYLYALWFLMSSLLWICWPNWFSLDIAAVSLCLVLLYFYRNVSFWNLAMLSSAIVVYDLIAVFKTKMMLDLADLSLGSLPILLTAPSTLSLAHADPALMLGLGDIIVPGLIVIFAFRQEIMTGAKGLVMPAVIGWIVGYLLTLTMCFITGAGQPATIFLCPMTMTGLLLAARNKNKLVIYNS